MFVKEISTEDFLENRVGRLSNNCFEGLSNKFSSKGSPIYLPNFGSKFSRTKNFCFENWIFYSHSA